MSKENTHTIKVHNKATGETKTIVRPKSRKEIAAIGAEAKKITSKYMTLVEIVAFKLESMVREYRYVDVSKYAAEAIGCSETTLRRAIEKLEKAEIAKRFYVPVAQKNTSLQLTLRILAPVDAQFVDVATAQGNYYHVVPIPETSVTKEQGKVLKSSTYGLTLEQKLAKVEEGDFTEAQKRSLRSVIKSEDRTDKGKRAWALKRQGYSNVAIAKTLGLSESTVRVLLKPFMQRDERVEKLMAAAQEALEDAREDILKYFTSIPEFQQVFGDGLGDAYVLRVHTAERTVEISPSRKRVEFTLKFWAQNRKAE